MRVGSVVVGDQLIDRWLRELTVKGLITATFSVHRVGVTQVSFMRFLIHIC